LREGARKVEGANRYREKSKQVIKNEIRIEGIPKTWRNFKLSQIKQRGFEWRCLVSPKCTTVREKATIRIRRLAALLFDGLKLPLALSQSWTLEQLPPMHVAIFP